MTDVGLERLSSLPNLKELAMGGNELGDAGFRQMPTLTYLDLSGRQGNDKNVWTIAMSNVVFRAVLTLKNLRELRFAGTLTAVGIEGSKFGEVSTLSVTQEWLEQMRSLTKLQALKLQGCKRIDDRAVAAMIAMPALREADLKGTSMTEKGAARLRAARPGMKVTLAVGRPRPPLTETIKTSALSILWEVRSGLQNITSRTNLVCKARRTCICPSPASHFKDLDSHLISERYSH